MELNEALTQIDAIRRQIARTATFRGYGPATVASTGVLAVVAAAGQAVWVPAPAARLDLYLAIWVGTAALCAVIVGIETALRTRREHSGLADEMIWAAVEQFLPAAVAGLLLTAVLVRFAPGAAWLLPGLWQIVFSLGVFASCRSLPGSFRLVGVFYLLTGLACVSLGPGGGALSPWTMGFPYGTGQILAATLLWWTVER